MDSITLACGAERRRDAVRARQLNGLDYLEVERLDAKRWALRLFFLGQAPDLLPANVQIADAAGARAIAVTDVARCHQADRERDECVMVLLERAGDYGAYILRLVDLDAAGKPTDQPLSGFDPRYAQLTFRFAAACPGDLDCAPEPPAAAPEPEAPAIDYLAKDYASFRQLTLDRLALIMPEWRERHVPDVGVALVELLAYVGDQLSYYQDAVANEAYLGTARQRISVRRHARLVDYRLHEGCNARTWVALAVKQDLALEAGEIFFTTEIPGLPNERTVLHNTDLQPAGYEVFEPLLERGPASSALPTSLRPEELVQRLYQRGKLYLFQHHNRIDFYTWGDGACCLAPGATTATLRDGWEPITLMHDGHEHPADPRQLPRRLRHLRAGDVLIFEEAIGPRTGDPADASPARRHAVRLSRVQPANDALYREEVPAEVYNPHLHTHYHTVLDLPTPVVEIEWAPEDALPFPLCLSAVGPAPECRLIEHISVAHGNVVLADHGRRIEQLEALGQVPVADLAGSCVCVGVAGGSALRPARFHPRLAENPLTFSQALAAGAPASQLLRQDPRQAVPQLELLSLDGPTTRDNGEPQYRRWQPAPDLLGSGARDAHFVAEIDDRGRAQLRFGNGALGARPAAGEQFIATYRTGSGLAGNIGAETIRHVVLRGSRLASDAIVPRNPLPACGGCDPEPIEQAKLLAPDQCRVELLRAITADDYAQIVMRDFADRVQRAAATLSWTGSHAEVCVAIDPRGGAECDPALLAQIAHALERFRRVGHDLRVQPARFVPLAIELRICVAPHYLRGHVKAALLDRLSNRPLAGGQRGFFHPDNLSFGDSVYLSALVAAARGVPGVEHAEVTRLERRMSGAHGEIERGVLSIGLTEIARLDNDPSFPANGTLTLKLEGGR